jgi:oxygen-independent coproporphyrinogen-3 oxidase
MNPGVYIHIPFCEQRCHYCAFTVAVTGVDAHEPYVRRLVREIELSGNGNSPAADTIFLGGGTPSILSARLVETILAALPPGATEISLESNPGTLGQSKIDRYREIGVNRISLGVQSFHDDDLRDAGRLHTVQDVFSDFDALRKAGFTNINLDLIAGLPNQTLETWRQNMNCIDNLRPEHVSIYMLEAEEQSAWGRVVRDAAHDENLVRFYRHAAERLEQSGYVHYEISNWALPGFQCRHNLKYWTGAPYRGFGVSAHSFEAGRRFWNTSSMKEYASLVDAGGPPLAGDEVLTPELRIEERFLLGLRQTAGFNIWAAAAELGFRYPPEWFRRVKELEDGGLVAFDGDVLRLSPDGWLLATGVTQELLWPTLLSTSEATR